MCGHVYSLSPSRLLTFTAKKPNANGSLYIPTISFCILQTKILKAKGKAVP